MKRFLRHLQRKGGRVFVVDEYMTSQTCCECFQRTVPFRTVNEPKAHRKWREKKASRGESVCAASSYEVHGLRTCQKCRKTLNRDVNAAVNMTLVGVCHAFGEGHPFRREAPTRRDGGTQEEELYPLVCTEKPSWRVESLSEPTDCN